MACRWRVLLVLSFFNRFWAERGVDRGRSVVKRNVSELANLPLEGYFRALYTPLGGWRDKAFPPSMKLYFSMFNDKPPWVVREFGGRKPSLHRRNSASPCSEISPLVCPSVLALLIVLLGAAGAFFFFLSLCNNSFFFLDSAATIFSSAFFSCFSFSSSSRYLCLFFFLLFSFFFFDSVFSPDGLCTCRHLLV